MQQVVVDAVYAGLVRARINQRDEVIEISSTVGRDVRVECIPEMAASLRAWVQRSGALVEEIDEKMAFITNQTVLAAEHKRQAAAEAVAVRKDFIMNGANRLRHLGVIGREDMDMMERSMSGERDKNTRSTRSRFDA